MTNNLSITGRIKHKLEIVRGTSARGTWSKQEFVLEYTEGNFPSEVCMSVWGDDKVNDLARYRVGEEVTVSFNLSSREFKGKYYNDVRAWKIEAVAQASAPAAANPIVATAVPRGIDPAELAPHDDDFPF